MDKVQLVTVKFGHQNFALPLGQVENVIASSGERLDRNERSGTMPLWLSPHRLHYLSDRLPIIELSRRLGLAMVERVDSCEMVIANVGEGVRCALAVDEAKGIITASLERLSLLPRWMSAEPRPIWGCYLGDKDELVLLLDCEALFTASERNWLKQF